VEEIPAYDPCGEGPHVYVRLTREGETTASLRRRLADSLGLSPDQVGYAGLKDKHARSTQTFSLLVEDLDKTVKVELDGVTVESPPVRHRNKLKPGHLRGNRFTLALRNMDCPPAEAKERLEAIARACEPTGWPNYFGPQRQGTHGDNWLQGLAMLRGRGGGGKKKPWLRKLLLSAWQSERFDSWLAARLGAGAFDALLAGDVAKKTDTGGLFDVEDPDAELPRLRRHDIVFTGPMFGFKMRAPAHDSPAAAAEDELLEEAELPPTALKRCRLPGTRRPARLHPGDLTLSPGPRGETLTVSFSLPKGAYATTVMREFMKTPA